MIDLDHLAAKLDDLAAECVTLGISHSSASRVRALRDILPTIEHARERRK